MQGGCIGLFQDAVEQEKLSPGIENHNICFGCTTLIN